MKNISEAILILCLFSLTLKNIQASESATLGAEGSAQIVVDSVNQTRDSIEKNFVKIAMDEISANQAKQLRYPEIKVGIQNYSIELADILFDAGMELEKASLITEKIAPLYGQAILEIFSGKKLNRIIQEYTYKISDILLEYNITPSLRSQIVSLTNENFSSMDSLLKGIKE